MKLLAQVAAREGEGGQGVSHSLKSANICLNHFSRRGCGCGGLETVSEKAASGCLKRLASMREHAGQSGTSHQTNQFRLTFFMTNTHVQVYAHTKGTSPWSSRQGALSPASFADFRPSIADFRLRPGPQSCDTWRLPAPFGSMKVCSEQRGLLFFHLLKNMQKTTGFKGNLSLGIFLYISIFPRGLKMGCFRACWRGSRSTCTRWRRQRPS